MTYFLKNKNYNITAKVAARKMRMEIKRIQRSNSVSKTDRVLVFIQVLNYEQIRQVLQTLHDSIELNH